MGAKAFGPQRRRGGAEIRGERQRGKRQFLILVKAKNPKKGKTVEKKKIRFGAEEME